MLSRILVPLDGSPLAESVLPQVVELATLRKAEVVLVRVALAHTLPGANQADAQVRAVESAQRYLTKIEADLAAQGIAAKGVVRYGHAAEEILDHARTGGIDLIAMSTHGRSGIRRWVLGSVAETVARRAPVPVMLLHARGRVAAPEQDRAHEPPLPAPSLDAAPPVRIRHILCPVDLSPLDREVLQSAGAMAQRFDADLTVLHAVYDPWDVACSHIPHAPLEQLREEMIRVAEDTLRHEVRRTLRAGPADRRGRGRRPTVSANQPLRAGARGGPDRHGHQGPDRTGPFPHGEHRGTGRPHRPLSGPQHPRGRLSRIRPHNPEPAEGNAETSEGPCLSRSG